MKRFVLATTLFALPSLVLAVDPGADQDAYKHIQFCYGVYTKKPWSTYALQRDMQDLDRAGQRLRAYLKGQYSDSDRNKMAVNGAVEGFLLTPKPDVSPDKIVRSCREAMKVIADRY